jgi:hypothetical protein
LNIPYINTVIREKSDMGFCPELQIDMINKNTNPKESDSNLFLSSEDVGQRCISISEFKLPKMESYSDFWLLNSEFLLLPFLNNYPPQ